MSSLLTPQSYLLTTLTAAVTERVIMMALIFHQMQRYYIDLDSKSECDQEEGANWTEMYDIG